MIQAWARVMLSRWPHGVTFTYPHKWYQEGNWGDGGSSGHKDSRRPSIAESSEQTSRQGEDRSGQDTQPILYRPTCTRTATPPQQMPTAPPYDIHGPRRRSASFDISPVAGSPTQRQGPSESGTWSNVQVHWLYHGPIHNEIPSLRYRGDSDTQMFEPRGNARGKKNLRVVFQTRDVTRQNWQCSRGQSMFFPWQVENLECYGYPVSWLWNATGVNVAWSTGQW